VWLWATAEAHPVGDRAAAQSTSLVLHRDAVEVTYQADVPTILVATARPGSSADPLPAMATELASGLLLVVDGQVVSMRIVEPSPPPEVGSHSVAFQVRLEAPLPAGARRVEVQTGNLPEAANFYRGDVQVTDGLEILDCSLLALDHGRIVRDDTLRWRRGDENRTLSVTLGPRPPLAWGWLVPPPDHPIAARDALVRGRFGFGPLMGLAAAFCAIPLGAAAGERAAAGIAAAGLALGFVPYGPVVALVGAVALLKRPAWAAGAAGAALIATIPSPRAALVAWALVALGTAIPGGSRLRWAAIAVAVGVVATRWL
jgi:hypothetical protein